MMGREFLKNSFNSYRFQSGFLVFRLILWFETMLGTTRPEGMKKAGSYRRDKNILTNLIYKSVVDGVSNKNVYALFRPGRMIEEAQT